MTADINAQLDQILCLFHAWMQGSKVGRGFNSRALVIGDFRNVQVQYDSQLEQTDVDLDASRCRVVDFAVLETSEPWRAALYEDARNLYTGLAVWNSPRLPRDPISREIICEEARQLLAMRLIGDGLIEVNGDDEKG